MKSDNTSERRCTECRGSGLNNRDCDLVPVKRPVRCHVCNGTGRVKTGEPRGRAAYNALANAMLMLFAVASLAISAGATVIAGVPGLIGSLAASCYTYAALTLIARLTTRSATMPRR